MSRNAYVLTTNRTSQRAVFSKELLEKVGFNVIFFDVIKHRNKVISNKISMQSIYVSIYNDPTSDWSYVFEDDVDLLQDITLSEIIEYENISDKIMYLGCCRWKFGGPYDINNDPDLVKTEHIVNTHPVYRISGKTRGLHAIGLSPAGCKELLNFSINIAPNEMITPDQHKYMDCILEKFIEKNPANVIRHDLESDIEGHRGIFFQNRNKFGSSIH